MENQQGGMIVVSRDRIEGLLMMRGVSPDNFSAMELDGIASSMLTECEQFLERKCLDRAVRSVIKGRGLAERVSRTVAKRSRLYDESSGDRLDDLAGASRPRRNGGA